MFNPEYADAIVENMACTMIRLYGIVLSEYPNALKQAVEALAHEDVRYVRKGKEKVWIGSAAIATELQIDVLEPDVAKEMEPEKPVKPHGAHIGHHQFEVWSDLTVQDERQKVLCRVEIIIDDYEPNATEDLEDTDDMKYERSVQVVFYVQE